MNAQQWMALWRQLSAVALATAMCAANAQAVGQCPDVKSEAGHRLVVVISDTHAGLGKGADGRWHAQEDFRWPKAMRGFLKQLSTCSSDDVDLVIAGDLLELWQPSPDARCKSDSAELGCTPAELSAITRQTTRAHADTLAALGKFADRGRNAVHIIPGNHDSALLLDEPWAILKAAMGSTKDRVRRVDSGVWLDASGTVVVEHGHQIGSDVNSYPQWPSITRKVAGQEYVVRPWGERFVQKIFNDEETQYPVIDNLSPEAAGARYRMADRGMWRSIADVARFLAFNAFETSLWQKGNSLGPGEELVKPDIPYARKKLGHKLFANALPQGDPFRASLLGDSPEAAKLRLELDQLAQDRARLPDVEVELLCEQMVVRTARKHVCREKPLGAAAQKVLGTKRGVMAAHLKGRLAQPDLKNMRAFVYGHTHLLEEPWSVAATDLRKVTVANSGAFQRVVDDKEFRRIAKSKRWALSEALRKMTVDDLPACYTAVVVALSRALPEVRTLRWHMQEEGAGKFLAVGTGECR